jgi:hypothetical protein
MHRAENQQKEFKKKSRTKNNTYNSYATPKFLTKKISKSSLPHAKKVQKVNDTFVSKSDKYTIAVPLTATGNIILKETTPKAFKRSKKSKKNTYNFMISLPNKENSTFSGKAKVAKENSIVYKDYQENIDVVVQALKGSVRVLTILNDADAPTEYVYNVNVPTGGYLKKLQDGSIDILDKNGKAIGGFAPAWAVDKNGKKVPTHYKIKGNKLIQIVEHLSVNVEYPVVADPNGGNRMVWATDWEKQPQNSGNRWFHWKLNVTPTSWSRWKHQYSDGLRGWNEIRYVQYILHNGVSMKNQYICHVQNAWFRSGDYHLEHWRPATSYWRTVAYLCNPPGHI